MNGDSKLTLLLRFQSIGLVGMMGVAGTLLACGGTETRADSPDDVSEVPRPRPDGDGGLLVGSAVGAMNAADVRNAMNEIQGQLSDCVEDGRRRLPMLGGVVHFTIRVDTNGKPVERFFTASTMGDHEVESCMLKVVGNKRWPRPVGGDVGEIAQTLDYSGGEEDLIEWDEAALEKAMSATDGSAFAALEDKLADCGSPLMVTIYLDEDGFTKTFGAVGSGIQSQGDEAIRCVDTIVQTTSFPAPSSAFAKVTVKVP